ncbi:MAG: DUF3422 domain-containing protein [Kiloniellales bacterium]
MAQRWIDLHPHPWRDQLVAEAHARPPATLTQPALISRLVMESGERGEEKDHDHLVALCRSLGVPEPSATARRHKVDAGGLTIVWERHTEFSTYTLMRAQSADRAVQWRAAVDAAPKWWRTDLPGRLLAAVHVAVRRQENGGPERSLYRDAFGKDRVIESSLTGGTASVAADFRPDGDGFVRMLVFDNETSEIKRGRLVQTLLEIETYRMAALLGFAQARETGGDLRRLEDAIVTLSEGLSAPADVAHDRDLLQQLTTIAGEAEALRTRTTYRYAATQAYWRIVRERIESLQEQPLDGGIGISGFIERRLAPAYRTCLAADTRQNALTDHIARATRLLATRVEVKVSEQNAELLLSMDRRAKQQLRLQETVEGLSVVAITYYAVGLVGYLAEGLNGLGVAVDKTVVTLVAVPIIALAVGFGVRRLRRRLTRDEGRA